MTRFNGRRAPARPGADITQAEAYSHECISAGYWPGNGGYGQAAFYSYAAPVPSGLSEAVLTSKGAFNKDLGEFLLNYNYDDVRQAPDPAQEVLNFLEATHSAAADAAKWDRANFWIGMTASLPRLFMHESATGLTRNLRSCLYVQQTNCG